MLHPGSFKGIGGDQQQMFNDLFYYSFISILTVGYGDIVAVPGQRVTRPFWWCSWGIFTLWCLSPVSLATFPSWHRYAAKRRRKRRKPTRIPRPSRRIKEPGGLGDGNTKREPRAWICLSHAMALQAKSQRIRWLFSLGIDSIAAPLLTAASSRLSQAYFCAMARMVSSIAVISSICGSAAHT
ncbi:Ion channel [Edwardsiella tarda]|nr:Ion channel [Edwardsiella tarda]